MDREALLINILVVTYLRRAVTRSIGPGAGLDLDDPYP